mgnify:CR=1 FL=1
MIHRWLNAEALAFWFMDDGTKINSGYILNSQGFTLNENKRLANALGKNFKFEVPEKHNSFIYLLKGELIIGEKKHSVINDSNLILLKKGKKLIVKGVKKTEFLFVAGKPIGEPIARGGPFVMNTKAEILEAIQDYNNGTFAKY